MVIKPTNTLPKGRIPSPVALTSYRASLLPLFFSLFLFPCLPAPAAELPADGPPEVSNVHPDFMGAHDSLRQQPHRQRILRHSPQIITGENFAAEGLRIMVWDPPGNDDVDFLLKALSRLPYGGEISLPSEPPEDAQTVEPMDVEEQVIVASLSDDRQRRAILWIGNDHGYSEPYLFNVARPFWVNEERLEPNDLLRVFGYGLRREYRGNLFALKQDEKVVLLRDYGSRPAAPSREPFFISYETRLLETNLPGDLEPGDYEVYAHNGWGGEFGWRKAGDLQVAAADPGEVAVFDPRKDFGAVGDGDANDTEALQAAVDAAADAGGGVVRLAPGTYRIDHSLQVRSGVTLRGAGAENTIIEGFGFTPTGGQGRAVREKDSPLKSPFSVILLEPRTGMERLTIKGSVAHGSGGLGQVELTGNEEVFPDGAALGRVRLREVSLKAPVFHSDFGMLGARFYTDAFRAGAGWHAKVYRLSIIDSDFEGDVRGGTATRPDIIGNTIRGGGIQFGGIIDGLIISNVMKDDPYRMYSYRPVVNTYFRSNEIRNFGNRRVSGASEPIMLHGGSAKAGGHPTAATANTLVDKERDFEPGIYADRLDGSFVLITAGRGFGQYRRVTDNTADTLTLEEPWRVIPDETSEYLVGGFFVNTVFYDNFNDGLGRLTLWYDCINVVVENHRDNMAGGIDIWGADRSDAERPGRFQPSWYNMLIGNDMEGSYIYFRDRASEDNLWEGPVLFGNYIVDNNIVRPIHRNVRENTYPTAAIDVGVDGFGQHGPEDRSAGRNQYAVIINNTIVESTIGIRVPTDVRKTFVLRNDFVDVRYPILDLGTGTIISEGNRIRSISLKDGLLTEELISGSAQPEDD